MSTRVLAMVGMLALLGALGCDDDEPAPVDAGGTVEDGGGAVEDGAPMEDPRVTACRAAIESLEATVSDQIGEWPVDDAPEMIDDGTGDIGASSFAGRYRDDLANHPGCAARESYDGNSELLVGDNEATVPAGAAATIPGYDCAAKEYAQDAEDTSKPIVILVHGNSSGVPSFEEYGNAAIAGTEINNVAGFAVTVDTMVRESLATQLLDEGYRVISFDARTDLVTTQTGYSADSDTGNPFVNIDHGWAVPMLQDLIRAVMTESPDRQVSLVGHSLGVTVIRDALRRLWIEDRDGVAGAVNPYAQLSDVVLLSGANHGVSDGSVLCDTYPDLMRGTVGCEMGDRGAFLPTYFTRRLNGPSDLFSAPCADGSYAFGLSDQCDGNVVEYTTVTMEDLPDGALQDEFISEESSALDLEPCVENELITLGDFDRSGYFFSGAPGFFANHFGSARSDAGIALVLQKLAD
jgi:pimeloyl-ACP methyl ester carboxylesterase